MNKQKYLEQLRTYRMNRRSKDWVRSWLFTSDESYPYLQFIRLNPEE